MFVCVCVCVSECLYVCVYMCVNKINSQKVQQKSFFVKQDNGRDMSPYSYSVLQQHSKNAVRKAVKACSNINWPPPDPENPVQF